jgi:hypothetical protein
MEMSVIRELTLKLRQSNFELSGSPWVEISRAEDLKIRDVTRDVERQFRTFISGCPSGCHG